MKNINKFDLMKINYDKIQEYVKNIPELKLYENNKIKWDDICQLDLNVIANSMYEFNNLNLDYLFNIKNVKYKEILKLIIIEYNDILKKINKTLEISELSDYVELREIVKNLRNIKTQNQFNDMLLNWIDYRTFDIDGFYKYRDMIFNYCENNNIKCEILDDNFYFEEISTLNINKINKLRKRLKNYKEVINKISNLIVPIVNKDNLNQFYNDLQFEINKKIK